MLELAIETSGSRGSIALGNARAISQEMHFGGSRQGRHSEWLFPELLKFGLPRLQLARVVVGLGPGSFAGIRVALAAAQGIAEVQGVPVYGVPSTHALGWKLRHITRLGIFADAKRGELYCTVYRRGELERDTYLIPAEQLEDEMSKMTLAISAEPLGSVPEHDQPVAADLLRLPHHFPGWRTGWDLEPVYLRPPMYATK
ncbi:MAG: tRNA (adenosine(37)-N6)-threonylcarbamoyltransferase complex dimerization subunit type 1 TsaB [Candidatus Methylacidiphilales bacterium]|nr:tRNA (adenosine(37)-N6)-threonylcarbamoyltransferase complex dimerization subunit type 1 TsaB [Candidatus Methylacidiphilales bacterium]